MNDTPEAVVARAILDAGGRIPFEQFMGLALYHPRLGYYSRDPEIGKHGDFFTSVSVGPLYGRLLARHFIRYREQLGNPPEFTVVECGGHRGQLRTDVLREAPDLNYLVLEAGTVLPPAITGVIFSNELLDAFPVHRVRVTGGHWQELYVAGQGSAEDPFREITGPLSTPLLAERLKGLPVKLMEGFTTEINLRASAWLQTAARQLARGYIVTVDYGHERADYFAPHRHDGTLVCFHRHIANSQPLIQIGKQDITSHVDFTALMEAGQEAGLATVRLCDQSHYLMEVATPLLEEWATRDADTWRAERNQFHQLVHPTLMGCTFKVLVQSRL